MRGAIIKWLRGWHRPFGLGVAAAFATLLFGSLYWREMTSGDVRRLLLLRGEMSAANFLAVHGRKATPRTDVAFLGIDDASLSLDGLWPEEIEASPALRLMHEGKGQWNWSREVQALVLDRLVAAGAKLVIFDMVFSNPNTGDEAFRAALDRHRDHVVIASQIIDNPGGATFQAVTPSLIPDTPHDPRVGYASYVPDFVDEVIRQLSFYTSQEAYNGRRPQPGDVVYPSLVTSALRQLGRADKIPPDGRVRRFRFVDPNHSPAYTAHPLWEVFSDETWKRNYQDGAFFKDKMVIVGAFANTLHDTMPTPFGSIPGPMLHLDALTAALSGDYLRPTTVSTDLLLILAAGGLAWGLGLGIRAPLVRLGAFVSVSAVFGGVLIWLYNRYGVMPLAFTPLLTFNTGGMAGLIGEYAVERVEKARVRGVLDRLVSKDIVRELLADRERYAQLVRGQRRPVTVLFSDVRGFTTLSERAADPVAFIAQLNEYLGEMVDIVFRHQGTLDKFIGDAVMAVWGSMHTGGPEADARQAVAAALEMRARLAALNARWTAEGRQTLAIGIGVNYGEVIVGGLGSEKSKMEITVMGDAVNTASRLEGLTKEYGLDLLIGESVAQKVSEVFRLRTVDLVRVKGKTKPTEVMTVLGSLGTPPPLEVEEMLADYEDAILLYRRREFTDAAQRLEGCLRVEPEDQLALLYLERCRDLLLETPTHDWDGVRQMTSK